VFNLLQQNLILLIFHIQFVYVPKVVTYFRGHEFIFWKFFYVVLIAPGWT